jgi:nitric oxide reductase subunit B
MKYGSIFGHGAYLGPDFTADYLHRAALIANKLLPRKAPSPTSKQTGMTQPRGSSSIQPRKRKHSISWCFTTVNSSPHARRLAASAITDPQQIKQLTAFFSWSAWTASALRPISITPKRTADSLCRAR